jgi:hypothetical protein
MYIGGGIALLAVGAILAFAVQESIQGVDTTLIGWILMGAGLLALILSLVVGNQRRNTSHTAVVERRDLGGPSV